MKNFIKFLEGVFTSLFIASLVMITIAGLTTGVLQGIYYGVSVILFIADIINCRMEK